MSDVPDNVSVGVQQVQVASICADIVEKRRPSVSEFIDTSVQITESCLYIDAYFTETCIRMTNAMSRKYPKASNRSFKPGKSSRMVCSETTSWKKIV